jgi:hypothetical protein
MPLVIWTEVSAGLPRRAFSGIFAQGASSTAVIAPPVSLTRPGTGVRALPLGILPLGFALNTLFYAAVLLGVVEGVAFARRRVRRAKGRCPSCGYDRAGLAEGSACPECGGGGGALSGGAAGSR